jgi:hypothetical protein
LRPDFTIGSRTPIPNYMMNRWSNLGVRVFFKVVILSLAALVMIAVGAIFHLQSANRTAGIAFFVAAVGLFLIFERFLFQDCVGGSYLASASVWD